MWASADDIKVISRLQREFYQQSQKIIEAHYLQALSKDNSGFNLPEKEKINLQDGVIERPIHGAMHVARAQFWAVIFHEKIKAILPNYSANVLKSLKNTLGLSEEEMLTLTKYALLFHDSARENEGSDQWEQESSQKCQEFFVNQGLSESLAALFSQAAHFKDKPDEYADFLRGKEFADEAITSMQYIRKLIFFADCIDIMRCTRKFKLSKVLKAFENQLENTTCIIEMAKYVHQVIREQKDMLVPCAIILPDGKIIDPSMGKSCFDLGAKVACEHAENVCSVIGASLGLQDEGFLATKKASVRPAFNPYIHGTNSCIFSMLRRTNFKMFPPLMMLEDYGLAPMSGEICGLFGGGLDNLFEDRFSERLCFGRMNASGRYNLDGVKVGYTRFYCQSADGLRSVIESESNNALSSAFHRINIMLVNLARLKQLGIELDTGQYEKIKADFNGVIQCYYLLMLFGKDIYPDLVEYTKAERDAEDAIIETPKMLEEYLRKKQQFEEYIPNITYRFFIDAKKSEAAGIYSSAFCAHFTLEKMVAKIIEANLDIKSIFENPTKENLQKVLSILELPKRSNFSVIAGEEGGVEVQLEKTQFFTLDGASHDSREGTKKHCLAVSGRKDEINRLFMKFFDKDIAASEFESLRNILKHRIEVLQEKFELLKKIVERPIQEVKLDREELKFVLNPFPIILICSAEEKIGLCDFSMQEYRAHEPIKFGEDITMIATDTEEHQLQLGNYLQENGIDNVSVVLIDQLHESQKTGERPSVSSYAYGDKGSEKSRIIN